MSYILEALRKSHGDRERVADHVLQRSVAEVRRSARRRQLVLWAGVGLLGVNAALLAWLGSNHYLKQRDQSVSASAAPAVLPPAGHVITQTDAASLTVSAAPIALPRESPAIGAAPATAIATAPPSVLEAAAAPAASASLNDAMLVARDMALERQQDLARRHSVAAVSESGSGAAAQANTFAQGSSSNEDETHATVLPDTTVSNMDADLGSVPLFMNMDEAFRSKWTDLSLDVHVFAPTKVERFVFINMEKYREGDTTKEGLLVSRIVADGVILEDSGQRFRLTPQ